MLLTRRDTGTDSPQIQVRDLRRRRARRIGKAATASAPAAARALLVHFKRSDSLELSGVLHLPAVYEAPLPALIWAYPIDFANSAAAAQISGSPHRYLAPAAIPPIYLASRGYAVLRFWIPVVGEDGRRPNDSHVEQLVAGATAAVDELARRGVADRERIAIGGHSYGASMTATLLAHSGLFRAGIAVSGSYNRTLTPFGFQMEERSFWDAPQLYLRLSPFAYADKIKAPLLLIHGMDDDNAATPAAQSERFFDAIERLGGTARLVLLPGERHFLRSAESAITVAREIDAWMARHVGGAADLT
jgi:dipeptidyl aminopeptidase/acylaminoacyl peptidase